ncbi:flavin reductase family protein [Streptomyces sp. NBC_00444]|uniref:flavin reductase family protein n=1 Tax=unclassified Streptomyces TaxID=2593676 RepID=UPI003FA770B9
MTEQQDTDIPDDIAVPDDVALPEALVAPEEFRAAMARFPSGVVVVTTRCQDGTPRGFTASSFCSVSLEPPMVLVCLANSADSAWSFARCDRFAVSVLTPVHQPLALRFATKGSDKFAAGGMRLGPGGLPTVERALSELDCEAYARHPAGDHTVLIGRVTGVRLGEGSPMVYYDRDFRTLA